MLEDGEGDFVELVNQVYGRIDVDEVVVGYFLAVYLVEHGFQIAEEVALLVGVLAVAELFGLLDGAAEGREVVAVEIVEDGRVVVGRHGKGFLGEPAALFQRGVGSALHEDVAQRLVLGLAGHDDHVAEVFGSGADERDAAYVDFLDDGLFVGSRSHGFLKGIEVDDDKVYFGDVVLCHLCAVAFFGAAGQDAAEYFRVEGFHASSQDGGIAREVFHCPAGIAQ